MNRRSFLTAGAVASVSLCVPKAFAAVLGDRTPDILPRALAALDRHRGRIVHRDWIGIVDFGMASRSRRFYLVDLLGGRTTSLLVSHGRGSDPGNSGWVQSFSNRPGSEASSPGSFLTGDTYFGKHGRSRRLAGLEPCNDQAENRGIVIHSASYVSDDMANMHGRVGRSQGCFAVSDNELQMVLARLGPGRLLFATK
ncbi:murein L,D-transpeptidase catalytic domain family protein [Aquisediminimonas profunda]|uniref:murein L,D-transpeptidase catalytic domain family protein n=1 Tax=Aquisediminimonas profunda TaxID=1550733 RepID=UPI001C63985B|nr:murein L,D-transpeptidase catalytic domain family protein [Aquisediminimonas profunda]